MGRIYVAETTERLLIDDLGEKWTINLPPRYCNILCVSGLLV
ncbi:hypothetical protein ABID44_003185 [Aquamicrobium ahrensii]|uniref:Uncharacterized protein n=1 Tax=Aquamicrobium ahrensii TaxID=469551 RepID=A0ABV2KP36_9HYPH